MNITINQVICFSPPSELIKSASDDFLIYCDDLCKTSIDCMDNKKSSHTMGFSYSALLDHLMLCFPQLCNDQELCFLIYHTPDFDPIYADPLTYLKDRYQLSAECFDVIDQGRLCVVTALHLLHLFLQTKKYQRVLIIGLEQNTVPVLFHDKTPIPQQSGVAVLVLSMQPHAFQFLTVNTFLTLQDTQLFLKTLSLPADALYFMLTEQPNDYQNQYSHLPQNLIFHRISAGVLPVFSFLQFITEKYNTNNQPCCCVMLIEGEGSAEWGVVVLVKK